MRIMAVDLGDARTGLAICDRMEMLASPICVVHETNKTKLLEKVKEQAEINMAELIIIGYPINMDGSAGERAQKSEDFAKKLGSLIDTEIKLWDERQTTVTATNYLNATNTRGKKRKNIIDAVAACVILESYLHFRKIQKNREYQSEV